MKKKMQKNGKGRLAGIKIFGSFDGGEVEETDDMIEADGEYSDQFQK
jgi:hypothetical protein